MLKSCSPCMVYGVEVIRQFYSTVPVYAQFYTAAEPDDEYFRVVGGGCGTGRVHYTRSSAWLL